MNRKQLITLLVLVVLIGGLGLFLKRRQESSWTQTGQGVGQKLLGDFDVNSVMTIRIRQHTNELNLSKKNEAWVVRERKDYPANFTEISEALRKLGEMKVVQTVKAGSSQRPRLELTEPGKGTNSGTMVELKDSAQKPIKTFLLGKKHMRQGGGTSPFGDDAGFPDGRYVLVGNADTVAVVSDPLSNLETKPEQWLDKEFFKIERVKAVSLVSTNATNSWKISRETETNDWTLAEAKPGEQLDANKASSVANAFSHPSFNDVLSSATPEQTGMDKPTTVTLATLDGPVYTVRVGSRTNEENYFIAVKVTGETAKARTAGKDEKPEEKEKFDKEFKEKTRQIEERIRQEKKFEDWIYIVPKWNVDSLLKIRSELMAEKKEEPKKAETGTSDSSAPPPPTLLPAPKPGSPPAAPPKESAVPATGASEKKPDTAPAPKPAPDK